nr:MAG TPA: hypothetical protein [Caudoviricetes sp.]
MLFSYHHNSYEHRCLRFSYLFLYLIINLYYSIKLSVRKKI